MGQIEEKGGAEISTVDPDCRMMLQSGDGRRLDACYNVQTVADEKNKLIVEFEVSSCPDDKGEMVVMTRYAKEIMGVLEITAVGDKGYYDGEYIAACESEGTICLAPRKVSGRKAPSPQYNYECFQYNKDRDRKEASTESAVEIYRGIIKDNIEYDQLAHSICF